MVHKPRSAGPLGGALVASPTPPGKTDDRRHCHGRAAALLSAKSLPSGTLTGNSKNALARGVHLSLAVQAFLAFRLRYPRTGSGKPRECFIRVRHTGGHASLPFLRHTYRPRTDAAPASACDDRASFILHNVKEQTPKSLRAFPPTVKANLWGAPKICGNETAKSEKILMRR